MGSGGLGILNKVYCACCSFTCTVKKIKSSLLLVAILIEKSLVTKTSLVTLIFTEICSYNAYKKKEIREMLRQKLEKVKKAHPTSILQIEVGFAGFEDFEVTQSCKNQAHALSTVGYEHSG